MIEIKEVFKSFGDKKALNGVSFELSDGKVHAILGPSGAGKTTLLDIITGCKCADEGSVIVKGVDISEKPIEAKRKIGYLPQIPPLYEDMTPYEYLVFVGEAKGVSSEKLYRNVEGAMELVGIEDRAKSMIKKLSAADRKKLGMAQAMLGNPDIILLDEPTESLGAAEANQVSELIKALGEIKTIVICSRKLGWLRELCDSMIIMSDGEIIAQGSISELENKLSLRAALRISVRGEEDKIIRALREVEGIMECTLSSASDGVVSLKIEHTSGVDIRDNIFNALASAGCPILAMEAEALTLEDVYLKICNTETTKYVKKGEI